MDHYKSEHSRYLKVHMTLLELAVWKDKLDEEEEDSTMKVQATKRVKIDEGSTREQNASRNVLPFLKLA